LARPGAGNFSVVPARVLAENRGEFAHLSWAAPKVSAFALAAKSVSSFEKMWRCPSAFAGGDKNVVHQH
jgi:hypothetical protein